MNRPPIIRVSCRHGDHSACDGMLCQCGCHAPLSALEHDLKTLAMSAKQSKKLKGTVRKCRM